MAAEKLRCTECTRMQFEGNYQPSAVILRLKLKINETKSAVARPEERKFLGFSISNDGSERRIAPKAL
jgi:hypothetical protein